MGSKLLCQSPSAFEQLERIQVPVQQQLTGQQSSIAARQDLPGSFDMSMAVLCTFFAFEAYNEPAEEDTRWEHGADRCDVAFMSESFAQQCYVGRLSVQLVEATSRLSQALFSGGDVDGYVMFTVNEEANKCPKEGAIGLEHAVDTAHSSTWWSCDVDAKDREKGSLAWGVDEIFSLHIEDLHSAQLAMTVFDEQVLQEDEPIGVASCSIEGILRCECFQPERDGGGAVMVWLDAADVAAAADELAQGTLGGSLLGGPLGGAAGAVIGSNLKKSPRCKVKLKLTYTPFDRADAKGEVAASDLVEHMETDTAEIGEDRSTLSREFKLADGEAPRGASVGVDWSTLMPGMCGGEDEAYKLLCFVSHNASSMQVAMSWARWQRCVVLSFHGTSDILDILTDVNLFQIPLVWQDNETVGHNISVHQGFFESTKAVQRWPKELVVAACAAEAGDWDFLDEWGLSRAVF